MRITVNSHMSYTIHCEFSWQNDNNGSVSTSQPNTMIGKWTTLHVTLFNVYRWDLWHSTMIHSISCLSTFIQRHVYCFCNEPLAFNSSQMNIFCVLCMRKCNEVKLQTCSMFLHFFSLCFAMHRCLFKAMTEVLDYWSWYVVSGQWMICSPCPALIESGHAGH